MDPISDNLTDEEIAAIKGSRAGRATAGGGDPGPGPGPIGGFGGGSIAGLSSGVLGINPTEHRGVPILIRKRKGLPMIPGVTPGPPGKSDTVPAMLTPGEIVMNRGVTENPQLSQLLLALNQRGASNMQTGVGPVGMEYGGRAGYYYGGQVPEGYFLGGLARRVGRGISKGAKWLKKNTTLKNFGKYVGANAAIAGAILGAPVVLPALASGAGALGSGAAMAGKGLLAGGKGLLGAGKGLYGAGKGLLGSGGGSSGGSPGLQVMSKLMPSSGGADEGQSYSAPAPATGGYTGVPMRSYGMAYGGFVPGFQQGGGVFPQAQDMGGPEELQGMEGGEYEQEYPEGMEGMEGMEGEEMGENYPSSAVRILQLLLELDAMERQGGGGLEGHAYGGFAGGVPVQGFKKGGFVGWLKKRFKVRKPNVDPAGYASQQQSDIAAARSAGYFDPMGNQALIRGQEEAARNTADALVRRQMTQASLGGFDPAQRAIAKQRALLETGRGVQDIMATTRANALAAQDQFYKNMYSGAAQTAQAAQAAQAARPSMAGQIAGAVAGGVLTNKLSGAGTGGAGGGSTTTPSTEETKPAPQQ